MDPTVVKLVRAAVVLAISLSYLFYVFQVLDEGFWNAGLGDWVDPYFINALLEHWYHSALGAADPSSPPMYFPVQRTLGYSHGLILYLPFYLPVRLFLHPFQAYNVALFVVMGTGILCLYLLLRKLSLSFIESLVLSAFFFSSQNVINETTSIWSQRASVFLIPPILLVMLVSIRMPAGRSPLILAWVSGLLATLMYVQDFYTAHLALLFAIVFLAGAAFAGRPGPSGPGASGGIRAGAHRAMTDPWVRALSLGAALGAAVFVWIYLGTYLERRAFPEEHLLNALVARDPSRWSDPLDFVRDLGAYYSRRSFALVFVLGTLAWLPWFKVERKARIYCLWFLAISLIVLVIPLSFNGLSVWRAFFAHLPGFGVIRDPKRIIYLYELAVVLAIAWLLTRLPATSVFRVSITVLALVLLGTAWNREAFRFLRPIETYQRWVVAPIDIDGSCRSFFIKGASPEYMSRSGHQWTLYNVDSIFVSLNHSIPTLNGYSAWAPEGWGLHNPQEAPYGESVNRWIERNELTGVCVFDIDARVMKPIGPRWSDAGP